MIWQSIPADRWIRWGKAVRRGVYEKCDGTLSRADTWEYFITIRLPWKISGYTINNDAVLCGWYRIIIRFKPGSTIETSSWPGIPKAESSEKAA